MMKFRSGCWPWYPLAFWCPLFVPRRWNVVPASVCNNSQRQIDVQASFWKLQQAPMCVKVTCCCIRNPKQCPQTSLQGTRGRCASQSTECWHTSWCKLSADFDWVKTCLPRCSEWCWPNVLGFSDNHRNSLLLSFVFCFSWCTFSGSVQTVLD